MKIAYFDCISGASGDMLLGALLDAGADFEYLKRGIAGLGLGGCEISAEKVKKQEIAATKFHVNVPAGKQPHRHLKHVLDLIHSGPLPHPVSLQASRIFTRLAQAEATVHHTTMEKVHFHEVGALDAIIDVVGVCLALHQLEIQHIVCSPPPLGSGTVQCDHGLMPVPAPATLELLKGFPIADCDEPGEWTTPTGAAILSSVAARFGPLPAMSLTTVGYGAGTREGKTRPNVLRVVIGESTSLDAAVESLVQLETNIDDCSPQVVGYCLERLLAEGALDAWTQPIQMKKSRPGLVLGVLCRLGEAERLEKLIFRETSTLGIRRRRVERVSLPRRMESVTTRFGPIRMKVSRTDSRDVARPEYDDCRQAAVHHGVAINEVMAEAIAAWESNVQNR